MSLFGTNGVRGKLDVLTPLLALKLSSAFARWCRGNEIALARDMRLTSPMLHCSAKAGIMAAGKKVIDIGLCSSPVAEFMLKKTGAGGLIIVTASHNPPEWNALKFVDGEGRAVSKERGAEIEKMAFEKQDAALNLVNIGHETILDAVEMHKKAVLSNIDKEKVKKARLRIVMDFGNGTAVLSKSLFEELGCEIIGINEKLDGTFPGRPSEPSEANVKEMLDLVRKNSADFGVAWDGDSDRVVFADEKGNWVIGDKGFAISAVQACLEAKGQKEKVVVTTVATSRVVEDACRLLGAKTEYTKVGAPYLSEKIFGLGDVAVSGGEEVGGIIWPKFSLAKDGIYATAKICEMVAEKKLSEYLSELPVYYNAKEKMQVEEKHKKAALEAAKKHAQGCGGKLLLIDGVRADFEDAWVIARASGTENVVRIFAEAKSQRKAEELAKEYKEEVEGALEQR